MKHKRKRGRHGFLVVLLVPVCIALVYLVMTIKEIRVVGNRTINAEKIIESSGVKPGDVFLFLNREKIRRNIEDNYYLQFRGFSYDYTRTLTLNVAERVGLGTVRLMGILYVLDEDGVVLEYTSKADENAVGPEIIGLTMKSGVYPAVGEVLPVQDKRQLDRLKHVLRALDDVNLLARVDRINIESYDNIIVTTREDTGIILGEDKDLTLKLAIAREVLSIRREDTEGLKGAWIDVSSGREAHFIPKVLPTVTPNPTSTPSPVPEETPAPTGKKKK